MKQTFAKFEVLKSRRRSRAFFLLVESGYCLNADAKVIKGEADWCHM